MAFDLARFNVWAVLVAGLIAFFIGALWYTALFGKQWIKLHGFDEQKVKEMQAALSPAKFFGGMILSYVVLAVALEVLLTGFAQPGILTGIGLGSLFWVGTAAIAMTGYLASDKPLGLYLIDSSCQLVYLVLIGGLLGAWQ